MQILNSLTPGTEWKSAFTLKDSAGNPVTNQYTSADSLTAEIFAGPSTQVLFNPIATWIDASAGTYQTLIPADLTLGLAHGRYNFRVLINTYDGRTVLAAAAKLPVGDAPGSSDSLSVYNTIADVLFFAPWIENQQGLSDSAGLVNHSHNARLWLEEMIHRKNKSGGSRFYGDKLIVGFLNDTDGYTAWLQALLDQNFLRVTSKVTEICSRRTIQTLCEAAISPTDNQSPYQAFADTQAKKLDRLLKTYTAEIDTNDDGYAEYRIPFSTSSLASNHGGYHGSC